MSYKRKFDMWLFESDVGFNDGVYLGRWALHVFVMVGYGSAPTLYEIFAITDEHERVEFELLFDDSSSFERKCVEMLGELGALLSTADIERINGFWFKIQDNIKKGV